MLCSFAFLILPVMATEKSVPYEVMVHAGQIEETIEFFKSRDFWGETTHGEDLDVPRIILAVATLSVGVAGKSEVGEAESEIDRLRASGELDRIIEGMRLD